MKKLLALLATREMAPTGANDTKLEEGDVVEWKLEAS